MAKAAKQEYNPYLDVLKGFTILLVVLGHSLQTFVPQGQFDDNLLFRIIYSFHMPLFMFLAGAAAAYSSRPMNFKFIERKFYQLVIPFIAWYLVGYYLGGAYHTLPFKTYIHQVIDSPDYGLWFLWVLFLNFLALVAASKLARWLKLYSYLLVWLAIYILPTGKYGVGLMKWHLPFFFAGYLIYRYRDKLRAYRHWALSACLVLAPLLMVSWHRLNNPWYITRLQPHLAAHSLQYINLNGLATVNTYSFAVLFYQYLVAFAGIGFIYWLLQLKPSRHLWKFFGFFGLYTLDIYVVHEYFFRYAIAHNWIIEVISGFIIATALSLALGIFVLRRVQLLSIIFLGGRTQPKALTLKKTP